MRVRHLILLFGLANAALFSGLLPLWEGFDEAFHYSYVESLRETGRFPVLGRSTVAGDVAESFRLAPVSHVVQRWIPESTTFDAWFALPPGERERRRAALDRLRARPENSSRPNYEAHQAPLAYCLLALLDWPMARVPLPVQVPALRLAGAMAAIAMLYFGTRALCRAVEMPEGVGNAVLFTMFCSEMLYATVAHVGNDWLAVGVASLFLAALAGFVKEPDGRPAFRAAAWLAVGLVAKAYFLAFLPLALGAAGVTIWRRRVGRRTMVAGLAAILVVAGPWYARNVILYGNVSGTQEAFDGIGVREALAAAVKMDWPATIAFMARSSLWTGNNSFTDFSRTTLDIVLALLAVALVGWAARRREIRRSEAAVAAVVLVFSLGIAYAGCASFADRHGNVAGASPWYAQVLLAPVLVLAYLGMARWGTLGRVWAACTTAIWTWVLIATWTVKLVPMYAGAGGAPMRWHEIWRWYTEGAAAHAGDLSSVALVPAGWVYGGIAVCTAGAEVGLAAMWRTGYGGGD